MRDTLAVVSAVDIHLAAAIGTVEQACEGSSFAPSIGVSSDLASDFLCKVESLLADNGFVGILENRPFVLRDIMAFLVLKVLSGLEIDGMTEIFTLVQQIDDSGRTPTVHILESLVFVHALVMLCKVGRGNEYLVLGQLLCNLIRSVAVNRHSKNTLDNLGGVFINNPLVSRLIPEIQWIVDEYAAEVVKRIFAMTIDGYGPYQIAKKLSEDKILIPSAYLAQHNEGVNKNKTFKDVYGWGSSTIVNLLDKREYLGHTVNFKTRKHFKDKKSHYVPEDEWTIFENTHEAIISQETFDLAQKIRSKVRRYPDGWGEAAPLTGLLYCADCGGKMYVHRTNNGKRISQYTCSQYTKVPCGTLCKTQHRINEGFLDTLTTENRGCGSTSPLPGPLSAFAQL